VKKPTLSEVAFLELLDSVDRLATSELLDLAALVDEELAPEQARQVKLRIEIVRRRKALKTAEDSAKL